MPQNSHILYKRYARALLSLAQENNILERSYEDMKRVQAVFRENQQLKVVLKSPVIRLSKKNSILEHIFHRSIHPLMLRYMLLVVKKQRGHMLDGISGAYLLVYKQYLGIERVELTTAVPLDDRLRSRALAAAARLTPCQIEFEEAVDPGIIGGFILRLGDKEYNASVKHRFARLKKHLAIH